MRKLVVEEKLNLKDFISKSLNISKSKAKQLIDTKNVLVNNQRVWMANHTLEIGDVVLIPDFAKKDNFQADFNERNILYEDDFIIAVNKPPFLISESKKGSVEDILRKIKGKNIKAIHRLDKETSGVLLFAKSYSVFERFKKLWEDKNVKKIYYSVSHNRATFKEKIVDFPVEGKFAKSKIFTIKTSSNYSYFKIDIKTGRKHQIRIHLSKIGHPIVGDKNYGLKYIEDPILKNVSRQLLHSGEISFFHPYLKKKVIINAPIPNDFKDFLEKANLK
jgi:RluA family pseudouridine synthase